MKKYLSIYKVIFIVLIFLLIINNVFNRVSIEKDTMKKNFFCNE